MADEDPADSIEGQIEQWRDYVRSRISGDSPDVAAQERQLREHIAALTGAGLAPDEAFLVGLKRLARGDERSRGFAAERTERVWKQLGSVSSAGRARGAYSGKEALVAVGFAVLAAMAIKAPVLFGIDPEREEGFYLRNASLFVLPCLIGFFVWKRGLAIRTVIGLAAVFLVGGVFANLPGFGRAAGFEPLTALHLPIALLLAVGVAYTGGRWSQRAARMDFVRFSGELFIYYVLIALGGGVLCAFMALTFNTLGINIERFFGTWLLPCGASGAVIIASWLVEAKQGVIENMAPVLTRLFTPLFAAMLLAFLATFVWSGRGLAIDRNLLIGFDLLLVVVLGLLVYSISARNPQAPPSAFDWVQVVLVVSALLANAVALSAIGARINEFGFSPNRVAALGENVILLVNLIGSAVLYVRFLTRRGSFESLERWQTGYLPVYAAWAAIVVVGFPPLFRSIG